MTLYTKYRPTDFSDMVGNKEALEALEKSITKETHSHVYLFSGPPGTGKTTVARIMASKLGASDLDIREINTASNRGIDTAREISNQMRSYPMAGSSIVYILDEASKWTSDFQYAMLKPLEDTPDHVYFFLCTTDPLKLLDAIRTRCTKVSFSSLTVKELIKIERRVCILEGIEVSRDILEAIAEKSDGSPRSALVLLEQVLSIEGEEERKKYIESTILSEEDTDIINLCRALLDNKNNWKDISMLIKDLGKAKKLDEPEKVRYAVLGYMNSVLLSGNTNPRAIAAIEAFSEPTYNTGKVGITIAALSTIL